MATATLPSCLSFIVEWHDVLADLYRPFTLIFCTGDASVEMIDRKHHRTFLKRSGSDLKLSDLGIGRTVTVAARQLRIVDFADLSTRAFWENQIEEAAAFLQPSSQTSLAAVVKRLEAADMQIQEMTSYTMNRPRWAHHGLEPICIPSIYAMLSHLDGGRPGTAIIVRRTDACRLLTQISQALNQGQDLTIASSTQDSAQWRDFFFGKTAALRFPPDPISSHTHECSLLLVQPHAFKAKVCGEILAVLEQHDFIVSQVTVVKLAKQDALECFEIYKGVRDDFDQLIEAIISGPMLACAVTGRKPDVVIRLRDLAGSVEPSVAAELRPESLRARFGLNRVNNGVHVTDLPEDGPLEVNIDR
ncbi:hypothetical protein CXG81DRAFT_8609 [Caulochytrium protostelioides]|uniref:Nucleoside diphosphate kinase n=1 Tax=Caulochytrium protostelioides TaxID=1555241 RepID=A0A4P9X1K9_9FUNG|nr:nucleoside diphosphate kinase [Caulochytrium protostelioides]RKP04113.1 hypothetical protein CXG81DRAFT_8609 [Caulochytrium protostelioides]|eukprot:RKP04113.1 hypothetical protein CXG81DRAFT_8609 [Caulochytrium protostelioides]